MLPVITDNHDTYFVQAQRGSVKEVFVWNAISGRLMAVQASLALKEVMNQCFEYSDVIVDGYVTAGNVQILFDWD